MFLIGILLPLQNEGGEAFPAESYDRLAQRLTERFGGVTSFTRAPGEGRWKNHGDAPQFKTRTRLGRASAIEPGHAPA